MLLEKPVRRISFFNSTYNENHSEQGEKQVHTTKEELGDKGARQKGRTEKGYLAFLRQIRVQVVLLFLLVRFRQ